jgi:hypothetical protein
MYLVTHFNENETETGVSELLGVYVTLSDARQAASVAATEQQKTVIWLAISECSVERKQSWTDLARGVTGDGN